MLRFAWDERKNRANRAKHGIWFEEAQTVFHDPHARVFHDPEHSDTEDRFLLLGMSSASRALVVVHCYPSLAYEWSNFRLALDFVNHNKGESELVLDPFSIQSGWFILDMASLWVHAEQALNPATKKRVQLSIDTLKLNADRLVDARFQVVEGYIQGKHPLPILEEKYPFIASEIKRQKIKTSAQLGAQKTPPPA